MINRRRFMATSAAGFTLVATNLPPRAVAQQAVVKIGLLSAYTGQFTYPASQMDDNGIRLYMKQHGDVVAGRKIEKLTVEDTAGAPDWPRRLAQELIVNDRVDILAGFSHRPRGARRCRSSRPRRKSSWW